MLLLHLVSAVGFAQPGALDPNFAEGGFGVFPTGTESQLNDVAVMPDGKIIATGYFVDSQSPGQVMVRRFLPSGEADTDWGNQGVVYPNLDFERSSGKNLVLQPDGKILVSGYVKTGNVYHGFLMRLMPDGTPDDSFDTDGFLSFSPDGQYTNFGGLALQPDGKIVLTGFWTVNGMDVLMTIRFLSDGSPDPTFNNTGYQVLSPETGETFGNDVSIQPDGNIVVAGTANPGGGHWDFFILRYLPNGTPDISFGNGGKVWMDVEQKDDIAEDVLIMTNGAIMVGGYSYNSAATKFTLVRLQPNGDPDVGFGNNGKLTTAVGQQQDYLVEIEVTSQGYILAAGSSQIGSSYNLAVVRYLPNGSLDPAFGANGKVTNDVGGQSNYINAIVLDDEDGLIGVGGSDVVNDDQALLVRYLLSENSTKTDDVLSNLSGMVVHPNPVVSDALLRFELAKSETVNIRVTDTGGKIMYETNRVLAAGSHSLPVPSSQWPGGLYWVAVAASDGLYTKTFVK